MVVLFKRGKKPQVRVIFNAKLGVWTWAVTFASGGNGCVGIAVSERAAKREAKKFIDEQAEK